jgi:DNA polymerase
VPLKYYGAHTGRFSGEHGINLGNLGGSGRGKAINKLISQVRHTMIAPEGYTFVMCDAAQIEARDLAKYAGQHDLVEGFRTGADIYSEFASDLFQTRVWKPSDEEKQTPEGKRAEIYRGFGKDAILGCGYGMGADKFYERCLANAVLRPLFDSGEYDFAFIKRLIDTYRTKYADVPRFWQAVERAWRVATKYQREETVGRLRFKHDDGTTILVLPSGRALYYRSAKVGPDNRLHYTGGNEHKQLWGGSITENIVQATCRDYLALWLLEVDPIYPVVHHVYDELVCLVLLDGAQEARQKIEEIMSRGPAWADDMPFKAEGSISPFYKK